MIYGKVSVKKKVKIPLIEPYHRGHRHSGVVLAAYGARGYLAKDSAPEEIAAAMGVATTTVDSYKERIKAKFGLDTIVECVASAVEAELVTTR